MKITISYQGNQQFKANTRHFSEIIIDEPESFHGEDQGPSPIEYFLIGTGSCIASSLIFCLNKNKVKFSDYNVAIEGKLKHTGPKLLLKLVEISITITFQVDDDESRSRVEYCKTVFQSHCPLSDSLIHGIPIELKINE
jgi:putative redox protein